MPWHGTGKAVLRCRQGVPTGAEPREDDWDAAANCPARRKRAVGTGEEDRPLAGRLPGGQLRSLQVKLARHTEERNRGLDQPVFRFDEIENAGNAEFGGKLLGLHSQLPFPGDHHRRLRRSSAITKFGGSRTGRQLWVKGGCVTRLVVRPVCPQLRKCCVRRDSFAWCYERSRPNGRPLAIIG